MFVDQVQLKVMAGHGGQGLVSFRREKFVDKGGPDGGNGGHGGSIIFLATNNEYDLAKFRYLKQIKATDGQAGGNKNKAGKSGEDLIITVPLGTVISSSDSRQVLADLVLNQQRFLVAKGGDGGFGNAHFKSSRHQTPLVAEKGLKGEVKIINLELKLLAEVGLLGLPNAGKSTFLQSVTAARPKIGAYPFTTLTPHLGVSDNGCRIADIPGLIKGAAKGKGLGHQFLRHIERNLVILHLIDCQTKSVVTDYRQIINELKAYKPELLKLPHFVALTKIEMIDEIVLKKLLKKLKNCVLPRTKIYTISSLARLNLKPLLTDLKTVILEQRQLLKQVLKTQPSTDFVVFKLDESKIPFKIKRKNKDCFIITGSKIEKFALKTDFNNFHARMRLIDIMNKMGITKQLLAAGYQQEKIVFGVNEEGQLYLNEN